VVALHTLVIVALGITWVLDGLEVTLAGAVSGALKESPVLRLTDAQVGQSASAYLAGAVLGALLFGWLADRFGRKRLFFVTLGVTSRERPQRRSPTVLRCCHSAASLRERGSAANIRRSIRRSRS
jgi:MFS family permease